MHPVADAVVKETLWVRNIYCCPLELKSIIIIPFFTHC